MLSGFKQTLEDKIKKLKEESAAIKPEDKKIAEAVPAKVEEKKPAEVVAAPATSVPAPEKK